MSDRAQELYDHFVSTLTLVRDEETRAYALISIRRALADARKAAIEECAKHIEAQFACPNHTWPEAVDAGLACASSKVKYAGIVRALADKEKP
jgi:hypothetical protein